MQISELKKGFWGYRKEDVYQYISTLNEEFSKKLLEKDEKTEGLLQSLQAKNAALEQELVTLKQENEKYEKMYFAVSDSIINAQSYAVQLKNETKEKEQALREQLEAEITSQHLKLESYVEQIKSLRAHLKCVLEDKVYSADGAGENRDRVGLLRFRASLSFLGELIYAICR